jgi:hypothetical protein
MLGCPWERFLSRLLGLSISWQFISVFLMREEIGNACFEVSVSVCGTYDPAKKRRVAVLYYDTIPDLTRTLDTNNYVLS